MTTHLREDGVLVVLPTYNELESLASTVHRLRASLPAASVLVVDDASPDGTGELADELAAADHKITVLHRRAKDGLAAAYLAGFEVGLDRDFAVVVEMDADGSHAPEQLPRLLAALETADVVLGSRYVAGGGVVDWPRRRELLSRIGNLYVRRALGTRLRDATGGYRAYRAAALRAITAAGVDSRGYCFQIDLAHRAERAGYTVVEVPITFAERQFGVSKMSGDVVREALAQVTRWGIHSRRERAATRGRTHGVLAAGPGVAPAGSWQR
ncbi:polyprenol monophosphomannose synthase [uncultured Jatrophihabitans sp.]|uniref:polyprenol monophosphomannose synthase n=1 Tax=uncultured Jatrophihabitans sp. TaxID=1610747 RepID=UPI0035CB7FF9